MTNRHWLTITRLPKLSNSAGAFGVCHWLRRADGGEFSRISTRQEFASESATIYVYGLRSSGEKLDHETGLLETEIAGCIVSDFILGRTDGYNERILERIDQTGYPSDSRKKWENELFVPAKFFWTRTPVEIQVLRTGATDVMVPHGRIRLSARSDGLRVYVNGAPLTRRIVANEVRAILDAPIGIVPRATELTLGPGGSNTVFFRWTLVGSKPRLAVLDVRNGEWLRIERSDGESRSNCTQGSVVDYGLFPVSHIIITQAGFVVIAPRVNLTGQRTSLPPQPSPEKPIPGTSVTQNPAGQLGQSSDVRQAPYADGYWVFASGMTNASVTAPACFAPSSALTSRP